MRIKKDDHVVRWAEYVKEHPKAWKKIHTRFINAQFEKHAEAIKKILKMPNGKEKIIELYSIKNTDGYKKLLG